MTLDLDITTGPIALFVLYLCRTTGLIFLVPILGGANVPTQVKAGLVVMISIILFLAVPNPMAETLSFDFFLVVLAARELLVGVLLGILIKLIFVPFVLAGEIVGHEMAFSMSQVVNPDTGAGGGILAVVFEMAALAIFVAFDLHHKILELLALSHVVDPPAATAALPDWIQWFFRYMVGIFKEGAVLVMPVFFLLVTLTLAIGLLSKAVPQMNVMDFSFPARILGGMAALVIFFPEMASRAHQILSEQTDMIFAFVRQW